jgi:quercetin dioxygenase-like cupin family protein
MPDLELRLPFSDEAAAALGIEITHHFAGHGYAKRARMRRGTVLESHEHPVPHLSILASGTVRLTAGAKVDILSGDACVTIEAGVVHRIEALTDVVWYCLHAVAPEDQDPAKVDQAILKG